MASSTALTLVNRVLALSGDYSQLSTLSQSPADVAPRIVSMLNLVLDDIQKNIDFPSMKGQSVGIGDGVESVFVATAGGRRAYNIEYVIADRAHLEEVTQEKLWSLKAATAMAGNPQVFARTATADGQLAVDIYPTPAYGQQVIVGCTVLPTKFTVSDTSATELNDVDELLVLGAMAHMDAYDQRNRGYSAMYEAMKKKTFADTYKTQNVRITPEDYR